MQYLGDWYEIYKFKAGFEDGQECIKANYKLNSEDVEINKLSQTRAQGVSAKANPKRQRNEIIKEMLVDKNLSLGKVKKRF